MLEKVLRENVADFMDVCMIYFTKVNFRFEVYLVQSSAVHEL